uniref:Uncharacterized LOC102010231 n=1 Tax=Chinchilla lanigera TaxID=34839 RepID=A0A8C2W0Z7_CHILA
MSLKSCEGESRASFPPSLLEEEDPGPWAQRPQNTSSTDQELLSSLGLSCKALVASGCLPFFRTCQWLPALQPEVCADQGGQTARQEPLEDAAPPSGFFPYYRSEEDTLPSLVLPSQQHWGSQDALSGGETQEDCFCETPVRDGYPASAAGSDFISRSSHLLACCPVLLVSAGSSLDGALDAPVSGTQGLCASGFVPYYRSAEEELRTDPGPPASVPGRD